MKRKFTFFSLLAILLLIPAFFSTLNAQVPDTLIVNFSMSEKGCVNLAVDTIRYTGNDDRCKNRDIDRSLGNACRG